MQLRGAAAVRAEKDGGIYFVFFSRKGFQGPEESAMPSTVVKSIAYNKIRKILTIVFRSGRIYDYLEVPEQIYHDMKSAYSKGRFFNLFIKEKYRFTRVQ